MTDGQVRALRGLIIVVIGGLISWFSYSAAANGTTPGGTYFIFGGAFLFGGWDILSGLFEHFADK